MGMGEEIRCRDIRLVYYLLINNVIYLRKEIDGRGAAYVFVNDDKCVAALQSFKEQTRLAYY